MSKTVLCIEKQVKAICARIGADPLLVQGAGGNASWKDGDVMWVKASGEWLADAESKEIFVPVNLMLLRKSFAMQDFSVIPQVIVKTSLRPSIETLLHSLMPHKVVLHLHPVEMLAYLVQFNARQKIENLIGNAVKLVYVDYFKPGTELARAVFGALNNRPDADVVFMGNHGVVIGGSNADEIITRLNALIFKLKCKKSISDLINCPVVRRPDFFNRGYIPCIDKNLGALAIKDDLIRRLRYEWALYPDHVVFLGAEPTILEKNFSLIDLDSAVSRKPPFIIAVGDGVYESLEATLAQKYHLRCYFEVVSRQDAKERLSILNKIQISELLDWDAEKYRQSITNKKGDLYES